MNVKDEVAIYEDISCFFDDKISNVSTFNFFDNDHSQTNKITLMLTQKCNLACTYCYGGDSGRFFSNGEEMSIDTAKKAIDYLISNSETRKTYHILFFGGEPLLNFDVLKEIVEYCDILNKVTGKMFSYSMTTNGTLLDDEMLRFFKNNRIGITVSLDGNEEQHDKCRRFPNGNGSYRIILGNMGKMKNVGLPFSIRATIPLELFSKYDEIDSFLNSLGAESVVISRVSVYDDINKDKLGSTYTDNNDLFVKFHKNYFETHVEDVLYDNDEEKMRLMLSVGYTSKKRIACGFMKGTTTVSTDGTLYPCHRFVGMKGFDFGNVKLGINKIIMKQILDELDRTTERCIDCFARYVCQRNCIRDIASDSGKFNHFTDEFCDEMRRQIENELIVTSRLLRAKNNVDKSD